jgi:hypothetical protein
MNTTTFQEVLSECSPRYAAEQVLAAASDENVQPPSIFAEFDVSGGVMSRYGKANTWIRFDAPNGPLRSVVDAMKSCNEVTDDDIKALEIWRQHVGEKLTGEMRENLIYLIRNRILGGAPEEVIPLDRMEVLDVEVADLPGEDSVLVIKKNCPKGEDSPPVSEDIFSEMAKTGEKPDDVVARRKAEGDPRYRWVAGAESRKHFFEVSVSLSVDYSLKPLED